MPIGSIILTLIVVGVLLYLVNTVIPMVAWVKTVINALVVLVVILWLAQMFGIAGPIHLRLR